MSPNQHGTPMDVITYKMKGTDRDTDRSSKIPSRLQDTATINKPKEPWSGIMGQTQLMNMQETDIMIQPITKEEIQKSKSSLETRARSAHEAPSLKDSVATDSEALGRYTPIDPAKIAQTCLPNGSIVKCS